MSKSKATETVTQHTPGSWWYDSGFSMVLAPNSDGGDPIIVAEVSFTNRDDGLVLAAAPDLMAALEMVLRIGALDVFDDTEPGIGAARAAIAKARGEAVPA